MIEVTREGCGGGNYNRGNYNWEGGVQDVIFLPDCALHDYAGDRIRILGKYLGCFFSIEHHYSFIKTHVRIVPELPLNQVIGIPSLKGRIFGDDDA